MKKILLAPLAILIYALFSSPAAQAITYGAPDCAENSKPETCAHPNTVILSGFSGGWSSVRCTGSLLSKNEDRILILTAGHCVQRWLGGLNAGWLDDIGVSFDAEINRPVLTSTAFDTDQFVLGGSPLLNLNYGPSWYSWNVYYDYAVVAFAVENGLETDSGSEVDLTDIEAVLLPDENFVLGILSPDDPPLLTSVGYGIGESLNAPGDGGNAGGASHDLSVFGFRNVAMYTALLNTMGKGQSMLIGSQNPARELNGTCNGDSGGPNFIDNGGEYIQIGVTSSGDVRCRGSAIQSRLDIPEAIDFLTCVIDAEDDVAFQACGCSSLNRQGIC